MSDYRWAKVLEYKLLCQANHGLFPHLCLVFRLDLNLGHIFACGKSGHWCVSCLTTAQQNTSTKRLEDRHSSGVVLSSVSIEVSSLSLQPQLDSATDLDPSVAACADSFMLDSFKDSDSLAVDLTYSSICGRLRKIVDFWCSFEVLQFILKAIVQG